MIMIIQDQGDHKDSFLLENLDINMKNQVKYKKVCTLCRNLLYYKHD